MNISTQLSLTAKHHPNKVAYVSYDEQTSYREFNEQVDRLAYQLHKLGYQKGDHIALVVWNSPYYIIALYAALRTGIVIVPINTMNTAREMKFILKDSDVKGIITMDVLVEQLDEISNQLSNVNHYIICDSGEDVSLENHFAGSKVHSFDQLVVESLLPSTDDYPLCHNDDLAVILYTSGTTGTPKGAMLSYKNIYFMAKSSVESLQIRQDDYVITTVPMVHVFGLSVAVTGPLLAGSTLLLVPKFSPREIFRLAKTYQATVFSGVPTMYNYLLQTAMDNPTFIKNFAAIRLCLSGGASMPVSLLKEFEEKFDVCITEGYGLTEAAPLAFNPVDTPRKSGSIGKSMPHIDIKIVDTSGAELKTGQVGELIAQGFNVMKGYYKSPEKSAEVLKDAWFYTGDLGYKDDQDYLYIVGRKKDVIIVGGYNVYPKEIEEVLYTHPNVVEVAVLGEEHAQSGERVIAYVKVNDNFITEQQLIDFCKQNMAKYKIPLKIIFLNELPKNTSGKIIKQNLKS